MIELLALLALGAWTTLDGVAVGQFMVSRPLVAGLLAGAILGNPWAGATVGALLELYLLASVPSGGGRYPEPGPAGVVAGAGAAHLAEPGGMVIALGLGLVLGWLGSQLQARQRERLSDLISSALARRLDATIITRAHLLGVTLDGLRGALLTGIGLAGFALVAPGLAPAWPLAATLTWAVLLPGALVSLGIVARGLQGSTHWALFALGTLGGVVAGRFFAGGL